MGQIIITLSIYLFCLKTYVGETNHLFGKSCDTLQLTNVYNFLFYTGIKSTANFLRLAVIWGVILNFDDEIILVVDFDSRTTVAWIEITWYATSALHSLRVTG